MFKTSLNTQLQRLVKAAAFATFACATSVSFAGLLTVNGDTTGDPTWNRTLTGAPPTTLSTVGTAVHFEVTEFHVNFTGAYTLLNTSVYDNYLHLYQTSFNPTAQFTNVVAADDDAGPSSNALLTSLNLTAGVNYFAVSSSFSNSDFGAFTLTIEGLRDNTAILGSVDSTAVPEPTSLALLGLGLAGLALARRRKAE